MTTIALTRQRFVDELMSLLFNMLSRLVIAFLPRSKCLLISWWQSPCAVILEPKKIKSVIVSMVFPFICLEVMGLDAMISVFCMLSFKPMFTQARAKPDPHDSLYVQHSFNRRQWLTLWDFCFLLCEPWTSLMFHRAVVRMT